MNKEIIVLAGGPSSGKTTLINALTEKGFICYPEVSREVIREAQKQGIEQLFLEKPLLFSELLLEGRIKQHRNAQEEEENIVFLDRGIPDVLAYMHYIGDSYPSFFTDACKNHIYTKVFILPPWKEIYESDSERYETYEQAVLIHEHLEETYKNFGYQLITIPKGAIDKRVNFVLDHLNHNF
ncbi:AAA family ATPase [Flavobacterium sp. NRK F10]|uniref:ATPase n=1 Tax=Flavobacterium sediminis TaxID=2201181 RepID=A0A2U8QSQ3_9FLAO|nr:MULTISPECIES: AAA family ATPase [Flavobacterium]AWM12875.1 ATPase [Flavobacterium sediminis]MCO6174011.1 AAA family ATPase [Flavobacterium sp. NRK F10]